MLALFNQFPALQKTLPYISLGEFPTPVTSLTGLSKRICRSGLFIKHDDITGKLYGGNKVRKLEFLLADARQKGATRVITTGAAGSNHALATAIYAREAGLNATLVLSSQPPSLTVRNNLLMDYYAGAEMVYVDNFEQIGAMFAELSGRYTRLEGREPYMIPAGGSTPIGALGYVNAGFELSEQIDRGEFPEPEAVYCAFGTMGTAAGLLLGLKAAGLRTRVVGVRVVPSSIADREKAIALFSEINHMIHSLDASFPQCMVKEGDLVLCHDHYNPGYGCASPQVETAVANAGTDDGILLDTTYSGKAFAAFVNAAEAAENTRQTVLFLNTKNSRPFPEAALAIDWRKLPEAFHSLHSRV